MMISAHLTFSAQKCILKATEGGEGMRDFLTADFAVRQAVIAVFVPSGKGDAVHRDRPSHGFAYFIGGEATYRFLSGEVLVCRKGDLIFLPQGSTYTVLARSPFLPDGGCYAINFTVVPEVEAKPFVMHVKDEGTALDCFKRAEKAWRTKEAGGRRLCAAMASRLLALLEKEAAQAYTPSSKALLLEPALEVIRERFTDDVPSVSALAEVCGMSETYFRRLFGKTFGTSPVAYIRALRVERAKELLASGTVSVSDAGRLAGFHDEAYFSREFRKAVGVAPSAYAKMTTVPGTGDGKGGIS